MRNFRQRYSLFGVPVSRAIYGRCGRLVPYRFRNVWHEPA